MGSEVAGRGDLDREEAALAHSDDIVRPRTSCELIILDHGPR